MQTDRVLIVVFDGLRPDMIPGLMPRLEAFKQEGVWFSEASSVFPSVTRVATTATATGCWPGTNGVIGNMFFAPGIRADSPLDTSTRADLEAADRHFGGVVTARTLGERLAAAGRRLGDRGRPVLTATRHDMMCRRHLAADARWPILRRALKIPGSRE